jgi:hypothetical protein
MKTLTLLAALAAAAMLIVGPAFAQGTKAQCQPSASAGSGTAKATKAPEKIEGEVTKVDQKSGTLTVKRPDGTTHEFKGSAETVREYKKGDRIELTLRSEPC